MAERADKLHHDKAPAHSTALGQAFFGKALYHQQMSTPYSPGLVLCEFWLFPNLKAPLKGRIFVNTTVTHYTSSFNGVSLPTD
jgi:hypothetical protein